jgi:hypothetical protein
MANFSRYSSMQIFDANMGILCNVSLTLFLCILSSFLYCIFMSLSSFVFYCIYMYNSCATSFYTWFSYVCVVDVVFGEMFVM